MSRMSVKSGLLGFILEEQSALPFKSVGKETCPAWTLLSLRLVVGVSRVGSHEKPGVEQHPNNRATSCRTYPIWHFLLSPLPTLSLVLGMGRSCRDIGVHCSNRHDYPFVPKSTMLGGAPDAFCGSLVLADRPRAYYRGRLGICPFAAFQFRIVGGRSRDRDYSQPPPRTRTSAR